MFYYFKLAQTIRKSVKSTKHRG